MATKRVTKKGCYVRPIIGLEAFLRRRVKFNISVPMAIESFTGKPFVNTWMQMKCGPMRWSRFWRCKPGTSIPVLCTER